MLLLLIYFSSISKNEQKKPTHKIYYTTEVAPNASVKSSQDGKLTSTVFVPPPATFFTLILPSFGFGKLISSLPKTSKRPKYQRHHRHPPMSCPAVGATPCRISASRRATLSNLTHVVHSINTDGIPFSLSCCLILLYHAICIDLYTLIPPLVSFTAYLQLHTAMLHYFNTSVFVVILENI